MELARVGATCTSDEAAGDDDPGDAHECAELALAPRVMDLPVNGTMVDALSANIPAAAATRHSRRRSARSAAAVVVDMARQHSSPSIPTWTA